MLICLSRDLKIYGCGLLPTFKMDFDFKVPSTIPQDLLLIQDLIGPLPPSTITTDSLDSSDDSIASTDDEVESEDEVEADLVPRDEDGGLSA